jgi:acetyltransferase-like isoleucine patch superfamily enzyme
VGLSDDIVLRIFRFLKTYPKKNKNFGEMIFRLLILKRLVYSWRFQVSSSDNLNHPLEYSEAKAMSAAIVNSAYLTASIPVNTALEKSADMSAINLQEEKNIHPTAIVSPLALLGVHTQIGGGTFIGDRTAVGENSTIDRQCFIDQDVIIGANVVIQNGVSICRGVMLESGVFISSQVTFTNHQYPRALNKNGEPKAETMNDIECILVRHGASIGSGAVITAGVRIGNFAMIAPGAVVITDVPNHAYMLGNPAKVMGYACRCGELMRMVGTYNQKSDWICDMCEFILYNLPILEK